MFTSFYTDDKIVDKIKVDNPLSEIKYIIIDVDGTLTDSGIYYDENGNELKKFSTKDAAGFFAAKVCQIQTIIITGRECAATERRMKELQVTLLEQGVVNKIEYLKKYLKDNNIKREQLAYIGDDLNDYSGMKLAGFIACPQDAADEIINIADYVSPKKGGNGAVRDVITYILKQRGQWEDAIEKCYGMN